MERTSRSRPAGKRRAGELLRYLLALDTAFQAGASCGWTQPVSSPISIHAGHYVSAIAPEAGPQDRNMNEFAAKSVGRPVSFDRVSTIEAATDLYWQSGVAATSFNEVSRALGVSKPTLYRYFGDEDGLVSAAIEHYVSQRTLHPELLSATGDIRTDLNAWFDKQIDDLYQRHEDAAMPTGCLLMECVQLGKALGEKSTATVHQAVHEILGMFEARLTAAQAAGQLRPGIDLNAAVRLVAGQTIIAKNVVLIGEPKESLKRMVALAIDGIAA